MTPKHVFVVVFALCACLAVAQKCDISDAQKKDCGYIGIQSAECQSKGCCWVPKAPAPGGDFESFLPHADSRRSVQADNDVPWCFYADTSDDCKKYNFTANSPGFDDTFYKKMYDFYLANLNFDDKGGVMASPDQSMKYVYDWMRDESLSMRAYLEINDFSFEAAQKYFPKWVQWVLKVQNQPDPNGLDIRIEPKFDLPDGVPYTGPWCRPQTDGPSLRAATMMMYANLLLDNGQEAYVRQYLWTGTGGAYNGGAIRFDLDWVANKWGDSGCDLWEEILSDNFFWNRMGFRYTLDLAADFAKRIGDSDLSTKYRNAANQVRATLDGHWNGQFMIESTNRQQDAAVTHAFASFPGVYAPTDSKIAATINTLNNVFCASFAINQIDNRAGIGGILYGRYPGDVYQGGNPWQLLTAALADLLYQGAQYMLTTREREDLLTLEEHTAWSQIYGLREYGQATAGEFASAALQAGDSVLYRLWTHVRGKDGMIDEQMDKNTGVQKSAYSLTWSYANIMHALWYRQKHLQELIQQ